jgi:putative chitinase
MIRTFQLKNGLTPDGMMGPKTSKAIKEVFCISTNEKAAHFLGQVSHESGNFKYSEENLNYSEAALLRVFGRYFTSDPNHPRKKLASAYAHKPEKIANWVYANRMGNGDEASGHGWKHRGFGLIQLTGKNNQELFANKVRDLRILDNPEIIAREYYFESALFFFNENRLWRLCEKVDYNSILRVSRAINLGNPNSTVMPNGMDHRVSETNKFHKWLCR